jgi:hypothetical protein
LNPGALLPVGITEFKGVIKNFFLGKRLNLNRQAFEIGKEKVMN